jgi:excisionase family DNA binding protein
MVVQMVQDETLLTFKEAMTYLRVSRSTLYRLMWSGQLTGHKVGSTWRFYRDDLRACVDREVEMPTLRVAQSAN